MNPSKGNATAKMDIVFMRYVLIYFNAETIVHGWKCRCVAIGKKRTEERKIAHIRPLECESAPCLAR